MSKSSYFFGQSVFGQLISLLDLKKIKTISKKHMSDHYVKKFDTSDHLISMLFSTFANCTSLREIAASMLGLKGKLSHFQLKHIPYRSTQRTKYFMTDITVQVGIIMDTIFQYSNYTTKWYIHNSTFVSH